MYTILMRQKKSSVLTFSIALICIGVYVLALLFAAYRMYRSVNERQILAEREFFDLADLSAAAGVLGFMDAPFQEAIQDRLQSSQTLQGVIISGPNGEYAFERKQGTVITWVGESPRFSTRFGISRNPFFSPLRIEGLRNVTISAVSSYIDYDQFLAVMKRTLLAVLAALTVAFITLVVETLRRRNRLPAGETRRAPGPAQSPAAEDISGFDFPGDDFDFPGEAPPDFSGPEFPEPDLGETDFAEPAEPDFGEPELAEADFPEPDFTEPDFAEPEFAGAAAENTGGNKNPPAGDPPSPAGGPRGLYSPETKIGWEEYTLDRLASELHRCAAFEQDLTLIVIQCREKPDRELYRELAERSVGFFNLRDLIFERKGGGITVIIPNSGLDQGFSWSEEFHNRVAAELPAYFPDPRDLCLGLSSRSGRLIDAERLLFEAAQALEKALEDPVSPIVAFKSDPEKYRAFIAAQNKRRP
jgi:hypothetical protein